MKRRPFQAATPLRLALGLALACTAGCLPANETDEAGTDASPLRAPRITAVAGNSELQATLNVDGLIHDALVITGENLGPETSAALNGIGGAPNFPELVVREAAAERMELVLPAALEQGTYILRLSNAEGLAEATLTFVQGEPGIAGAPPPDTAVTWAELGVKLPPLEDLIDADDAAEQFAPLNAAVDVEGYALQGDLDSFARRSIAMQEYALVDNLPGAAQTGYPTAAQVAALLARIDELPPTDNAVPLAELPDYSGFVPHQEAVDTGVVLGVIAQTYYTEAQADEALVRPNSGFGEEQWEAIESWIAQAEDEAPAPTCGADAVKVGSVCVDKFEARVGLGTCAAGAQWLGQNEDDYPAAFDDLGRWTADAPPLLACSTADARPSASVTWFQAQRLCSDRGDRLCSNAEWQAAVANSNDTIGSGCTLQDSQAVTGTVSAACQSAWGAQDMVGNLAEWTSDWIAGGPGYERWNPLGWDLPAAADWPGQPTDEGGVYGWNGAGRMNPEATWNQQLPTAIVRGGHFASETAGGAFAIDATLLPLASSKKVGFRCCRDL